MTNEKRYFAIAVPHNPYAHQCIILNARSNSPAFSDRTHTLCELKDICRNKRKRRMIRQYLDRLDITKDMETVRTLNMLLTHAVRNSWAVTKLDTQSISVLNQWIKRATDRKTASRFIYQTLDHARGDTHLNAINLLIKSVREYYHASQQNGGLHAATR